MTNLDRVFEPGAAAGLDPLSIFAAWFAAARQNEGVNPDAACLATVGAGGMPAARMVLVREFGSAGFVFYTSIDSHKGAELQQSPKAALCFYWKTLERQVRVQGSVASVTPAAADEYFARRDRDSQISAWASSQSRPLSDPASFERAVREIDARFDGREVPRPDHWSGYRVRPDAIEFWHGRASRRHDRMLFTQAGGGWQPTRLYP